MEIRRLGPGDVEMVLGAPELFDEPPTSALAQRFFTSEGHHLLMAIEEGHPVGFVSGVEMTHPDKRVQMFLNELSVDEASRRRGIGKALIEALMDLARELGCAEMWVGTETDNEPALATYRSLTPDEDETFQLFTWRL